MVIRWSEDDQVFVVTLPEFGEHAQTHGDTYEEAARNGREVLELLVDTFRAEGRPLPSPQLFATPIETVGG
jgi:predicted RNase H-like HicB family nuclease